MPFLTLLVEGELWLVNPLNSLCGERALSQSRKKEKYIFHGRIPHLGIHDTTTTVMAVSSANIFSKRD
jgi:hypothetical protein